MTNRICKISLFTAILACVSAMPVDAAVKAKNSNRSYANAYQQVSNLSYQQNYVNTTNAAAASLPVAVDDERLAKSIANNEVGAPSVSDLEACSLIYPGGNFKWGVPEYGFQKDPSCLAVVELRDATSNMVLASTTVAAGQSIKCNIDSFPSSSYNMSALSKIKELPADRAPTMEDVIEVMNQEQKQNAGIKIATGALIAGVAGNLLAQKEAGAKEGKIPLGTSSTQLKDTAIGLAAGAGIMAASSYSGKVAGDTIKSTAVNAASGMLIGNMLAGASGSDSVLSIVKCSVGQNSSEHDCVVGDLRKNDGSLYTDKDITDDNFYIISADNTDLRKCQSEVNTIKCEKQTQRLMKVELATQTGGTKPSESLKDVADKQNLIAYKLEENDKDVDIFTKTLYTTTAGVYYKIASAQKAGKATHAYAVFDKGVLPNKPFGLQKSDFDSKKAQAKFYHRYSDGTVGDLLEQDNPDAYEFVPSWRDADDGGLIDLSNPTRAKATIAGTAVGGAVGGLAGYEGAKTEVSERWTTAVREYEDSLSTVVCFTGIRFLSRYNDYADIPALKSSEQ